jgi:Rieske Fe-S protein
MNCNHEGKTDDLSQTTRRAFCAGLIVSSAGLALTPLDTSEVIAAQDSMVAYPPRRIEGAETLLPGSILYFNYPTRNDPAVLLRSTDGEYRAYSRRCSHAGCSVDFDPSSRCLKCPCHQGAFDARMGHVMFGPPRQPLEVIILRVRAGGQLWAIGKRFRTDADVITESVGGVEK